MNNRTYEAQTELPWAVSNDSRDFFLKILGPFAVAQERANRKAIESGRMRNKEDAPCNLGSLADHTPVRRPEGDLREMRRTCDAKALTER